MSYRHTQRGPLHHLLLGLAIGLLLGAFFAYGRSARPAFLLLVTLGVLTIVLSLCFRWLTVSDTGDALEVRFGPIPIFRRRIPYAAIERVAPARSRLVDGLGVHWVPGRGWTWNLWGFDCVELVIDGRTLRIGTDDREGLTAFLESRLGTDAA